MCKSLIGLTLLAFQGSAAFASSNTEAVYQVQSDERPSIELSTGRFFGGIEALRNLGASSKGRFVLVDQSELARADQGYKPSIGKVTNSGGAYVSASALSPRVEARMAVAADDDTELDRRVAALVELATQGGEPSIGKVTNSGGAYVSASALSPRIEARMAVATDDNVLVGFGDYLIARADQTGKLSTGKFGDSGGVHVSAYVINAQVEAQLAVAVNDTVSVGFGDYLIARADQTGKLSTGKFGKDVDKPTYTDFMTQSNHLMGVMYDLGPVLESPIK